MKRIFLLTILSIGACSDGTPAPQEAEQPTTEVLATDLRIPWDINKTGEEFYISERTGTIVHLTADGSQTRQQIEFASPLSSAAEAGFLGFVLKPDFQDTREAFAYYVYEWDGASYNKIVTLELEGDVWLESEVHLDGVPTGPVHHGGRLALSPDGELFASIGDGAEASLAQEPDSLNGKILQLNPDGEFEVYSSGHRNPQGFAWHDGTMYTSEHGQSANDEINVIEQGQNYGWPVIEGTETAEGYEKPFFTTGASETWAPSGITAHGGLLYVASLRGSAVNVIDLDTAEVSDSIEGYGRIRDVLVEDTSLFFITNNTDGRGSPAEQDDRLIRLPLN